VFAEDAELFSAEDPVALLAGPKQHIDKSGRIHGIINPAESQRDRHGQVTIPTLHTET
jgi:hypothetical protein